MALANYFFKAKDYDKAQKTELHGCDI